MMAPARVAALGLLAIWLVAPAASAKPAASALRAAAKCYAAGDMLCVIERLDDTATPPDPKAAAEHHRLLALAAARMDRHGLARRAFAAWIRLDPERHRLARGSVSEAVRRDWAAAWLVVHGKKLDLEPREPPAPAPLPAPVTAGDLPAFPPPPRSDRDKASGVRLDLFATALLDGAVGTGLGGDSPLLGGGIAIGLPARGRLRLAIVAQGFGALQGEDGLVGGGFSLRARVALWQGGVAGVDAIVSGGALTVGRVSGIDAVPVAEAGARFRYRLTRALAFFADAGFSLPGLPTLRLGVTMLPGSK